MRGEKKKAKGKNGLDERVLIWCFVRLRFFARKSDNRSDPGFRCTYAINMRRQHLI
jgi:hypothetical protein